jgi:hypothetical protein
MRASSRLWAGLLLVALGVGGACSSDSGKLANSGTGGTGGSGGGGATGGSGGGTGGSDGGRAACLDRPPGELDRPPNGQLPCELIPPGLRL